MTATAAALTGTGVWCGALRFGDPAVIPDAAAELEELGYSALWIPDVGGDVFDAVERLLQATKSVTVATGVLNLWMHSPDDVGAAHARLTEEYGDRFLVGIGVGHASLIDREESGRYTKPLLRTRNYLDALDAAPIPLARSARVLAALGPKMVELAGARSAGVHPYNSTAEHTAIVRQALGPAALVLPEQAIAVSSDPTEAREIGRSYLAHYLSMPNYVNNWRRLGFGDDDFADGASDRLVDAVVAWGDESTIAARVREHFEAGADHVCIQVLGDQGSLPRDLWRALAPVLIS